MIIYKRFYWLTFVLLLSVFGLTQAQLKLDDRPFVTGETLNYKAVWGGFLTIGSASTRIDKTLYRVGSTVCYKIDIVGQTNGLAKLFYVRDKWVSYIDTAEITTHKAYRSIREGGYELDEQVQFDHINQKAEVKVYDKRAKVYKLKKVYDTPEHVRDIVAGFMIFRSVDLSKYKKGEQFTINGFYEDEGYKVNVIYVGQEYLKTDTGKTLCYKVKPIVPKNKVFDGRDAVDVWLAANKSKSIVRIRAKMFVGNIVIDLLN
ncbi:MAG: DUF3108 domain-containing protein [Paludibacter sp.]|nr:DUF3108 domain-containing protein [Paludibacter sp.]